MPRYAVSSFIPDPQARYHCFHWPDRGLAVRGDVVRGMPNPRDLKVLALPCLLGEHLHWQDHANWVVLSIDESDYAEANGHVEFERGIVLFNGPARDACHFLKARGLPPPSSLPDLKVGGEWDHVRTREYGTSIAGSHSQAETGAHGLAFVNHGTATAGYGGVAVVSFGEAIAGEYGVAVASDGDASAGNSGIAVTNGEFVTAKAGDDGIAVAAVQHSAGGIAIVGKRGIALTSGQVTASVQADEEGILAMLWYDEWGKPRLAVAYVGEHGIQPNVPYTLTDDDHFIPAKRH